MNGLTGGMDMGFKQTDSTIIMFCYNLQLK